MEIPTKTATRTRIAEHRQLLYLLAAAVAVFVLFPQVIGINRAVVLLGRADRLFLSLALLAEALRYLISAGSTSVLARLFHRVVPIEPLTEAFIAGAAANRAFSTGGAPGMVVRLMFLTKQGVDAGSVAVIYLIEDLVGLLIGSLVFLFGVCAIVNVHPSGAFLVDVTLALGAGTLVLSLAAVYVYRQRPWVERVVHMIARGFNSIAAWFLGRPIYTTERVQQALDEFYVGMSVARRAPRYIVLACLLNLLRYLAGGAALYCAFLALGWSIPPGVLILLYTSASVLSTVSAVPGELAIMGGSWAILTLAFGVPKDVAIMALILSRTIAFWMPIPLGAIAFWNLRRQHLL